MVKPNHPICSRPNQERKLRSSSVRTFRTLATFLFPGFTLSADENNMTAKALKVSSVQYACTTG